MATSPPPSPCTTGTPPASPASPAPSTGRCTRTARAPSCGSCTSRTTPPATTRRASTRCGSTPRSPAMTPSTGGPSRSTSAVITCSGGTTGRRAGDGPACRTTRGRSSARTAAHRSSTWPTASPGRRTRAGTSATAAPARRTSSPPPSGCSPATAPADPLAHRPGEVRGRERRPHVLQRRVGVSWLRDRRERELPDDPRLEQQAGRRAPELEVAELVALLEVGAGPHLGIDHAARHVRHANLHDAHPADPRLVRLEHDHGTRGHV